MPQRSLFFRSLLLALVLSAEIRAEVVNDFSRLNPITVAGVIQVKSVEDIVDGIHNARSRGLSLSIAAKRNSQGGHTVKPGNLVLYMNRFNQVLALDVEAKTITLQSGISWAQIQQAINPHKLAIKVL